MSTNYTVYLLTLVAIFLYTLCLYESMEGDTSVAHAQDACWMS